MKEQGLLTIDTINGDRKKSKTIRFIIHEETSNNKIIEFEISYREFIYAMGNVVDRPIKYTIFFERRMI